MPNYDDFRSEEIVATVEEIAQLPKLFENLRSAVKECRIPSYETRINNLRQFKKMIQENLPLIAQALLADLHQIDPTPHLTDCLAEVDYMLSHLSSLMSPRSVTSEISFANFPATAQLVPEPVGLVLVVGTWNYPFHSAWGPVPGALAAGNRILVKPGSLSRNCSRVIAELTQMYFPSTDTILCVEGGVEVMEPLLNDFAWNHIFFTGSSRIGKIVMTAAAKHLVPVTLELGGKNPTVVTASADIALAARRIAWGKWASNAGQVCIAPDHVLIDASVADAFVEELEKHVSRFFPKGHAVDPNYCRVISRSHKARLKNILTKDEKFAVEVGVPGSDPFHVGPHIVDFKTDWTSFRNSACMQEEIFGPILPLIRYTDKNQVLEYLRNIQNAPLAMYIFSTDSKQSVRELAMATPSGAVVVNDTGMHIVETCLPFGGIGSSGMGAYHGKMSFEKLTHFRPILWKSKWLDIPFRYPPLSPLGKRLVALLLWLGRKRVTPARVGKLLLAIALAYKVFLA